MKRQLLIDEYSFNDGELNIIFQDEDKNYREDNIDEDIFESYVNSSGMLEGFEDMWDGYSESHYTRDYIMDYSYWLNEVCERGDILDFIYYYYKTNKLPKILEE